MQTFADTFKPRRVAQDAGPAISLFTPGAGGNYDNRRQLQAAEQAKHFRLWNYIAIDANCEKASESLPNVAVMKTVASPSKTRQSFLRQFYPGLIKQDLEDADPVPDSHPLAELLTRVNSQDWWATFCYETLMYYQLMGCFYWWVIPNSFGLPAELWVVPPQWIKEKRTKSGEVTHYTITPNDDHAAKFDVPAEEIIYAARKNPLSKILPHSASVAGADWLISSELIERARASTYSAGMMQNLVLAFESNFEGSAESDVLDRIESKFAWRHARGIKTMNRPIALPPGMKVIPFGAKPNEMLLPEVSDQIRDFILSLHRVPKAIVGLAHDLNVASIHGANMIWCEHKIIPLQRMLAGFMTERLAKRFDQRLVIWFDDIRPFDAQNEREEVKLDWAMGAISPDERRLSRNRLALETPASEKTYLAANLLPLDLAGDDEPEPEEKPQEAPEDNNPPEKPQDQRVRQSQSQAVRQSKRRSRLLKAFQRLHTRSEKQSEKSLRKFWSKVSGEVASRLEQAGDGIPPVDQLIPKDLFKQWFNAAMKRHRLNQFVQGVEFERTALGLPQSQSVKFTTDELPSIAVEYSPALKKAMAAYLADREDGMWLHIWGSTHKALEAAVQEPLQEGEGVVEIRERIKAAMKTTSERATVIARTEATGSLNAGQQALRDDEEIPRKQWIATVDNSTRSTHVGADMQVVDNAASFSVGGYQLRHPGDTSLGAPAEEVVQCRCCATGTFEE